MVLVYLIPKNIKIKREIFKGIGILELIALAISFLIGYLLSSLVSAFQMKMILFVIFPIIFFILLIPLPNGGTPLKLLIRFFYYQINQKNYKLKNDEYGG